MRSPTASPQLDGIAPGAAAPRPGSGWRRSRPGRRSRRSGSRRWQRRHEPQPSATGARATSVVGGGGDHAPEHEPAPAPASSRLAFLPNQPSPPDRRPPGRRSRCRRRRRRPARRRAQPPAIDLAARPQRAVVVDPGVGEGGGGGGRGRAQERGGGGCGGGVGNEHPRRSRPIAELPVRGEPDGAQPQEQRQGGRCRARTPSRELTERRQRLHGAPPQRTVPGRCATADGWTIPAWASSRIARSVAKSTISASPGAGAPCDDVPTLGASASYPRSECSCDHLERGVSRSPTVLGCAATEGQVTVRVVRVFTRDGGGGNHLGIHDGLFPTARCSR